MKIEIFTLCDAATEDRGKLNLLGSFDHLRARQAPVVHPACALAVKMRFTKIEEGSHRIRVTFVDEDGKQILNALEVTVSIVVAPGESTSTSNIVLNIQQLKLPNFGEYSIDLAVDGREEGSLPLYVSQVVDRQG
jgi:hypothetical protein